MRFGYWDLKPLGPETGNFDKLLAVDCGSARECQCLRVCSLGMGGTVLWTLPPEALLDSHNEDPKRVLYGSSKESEGIITEGGM